MDPKLRNSFGYSEWSGSIGDLGTLLPLAYALAVVNGFPVGRLLLLWGVVYIVTGWYFRVPVPVQPLKAMAVIALAQGFTASQLSLSAIAFGLTMLALVFSGALTRIERLFSPSIVRGIQLGAGLILVQKGVEFVLDNGLYVHADVQHPLLQAVGAAALLLILAYLQWARGFQIAFPLLLASIIGSAMLGVPLRELPTQGPSFQVPPPQLDFLPSAFSALIIPQLPLTLGNAVIATADACHQFWPQRSGRVSVGRLALSIGLSDVVIGLLGGFPICHGSGGAAAHARFGGRTGGTTIILGSALITIALIPKLRAAFFLVPVPLLGVLLVLSGLGMVQLMLRLRGVFSLGIAAVVGILSFATRNLTVALLCGLAIEQIVVRTVGGLEPQKSATKNAQRSR
ncbi:MAG: putative sulfate/molybdate transporter [candidate division KSB1 bacterium]|nr:putative sulfate/molybdate transporter [candidate division KSB1 bacterium]